MVDLDVNWSLPGPLDSGLTLDIPVWASNATRPGLDLLCKMSIDSIRASCLFGIRDLNKPLK